jgi:hypothetical protein
VRGLLVALLFVVLAGVSTAGAQIAAVEAALSPRTFAAARPGFAYDRNRPLKLRLGETKFGGSVVRQALTFDAGRGQKAAYWVHPEGAGPWPVVVFSPGYGGDATNQLPEAERLAHEGIASLTVAPPRALVLCRAATDLRAYSNYVIGRRRARSTYFPACPARTQRASQRSGSASVRRSRPRSHPSTTGYPER